MCQVSEKKGKEEGSETHDIGVPASVVSSSGGVRLDGSTSGGINDEENGRHEGEEENGGGENSSSGEFLDERTIAQSYQYRCRT